jgi:hypothetical protein
VSPLRCRHVQAGHANLVVGHSVTDVEAIWAAEIIAPFDAVGCAICSRKGREAVKKSIPEGDLAKRAGTPPGSGLFHRAFRWYRKQRSTTGYKL